MALTDKQKAFCKEYIIDLNATQAAIRAGYSEKTAYSQGQRMLKKVELQQYMQKLMDKRAQKLELTAENVLQSIIDIRENCTAKLGIIDKATGETVGETMVDITGALKANELLGKHLKLFTDKLEVEISKMPEIRITK